MYTQVTSDTSFRTDENIMTQPIFDDEYWMHEALKLANKAESEGEIPVGAIIVKDNKVIATGWNRSINTHDPSAHAEMLAIREAGKVLENYRMLGCTLYVTLEPCFMCAGLLVHSRIERLVFGADDLKTGSAGSLMNLVKHPDLNHQLDVTSGVLAERCGNKLSHFFKRRRKEIKAKKKAQRNNI
ncbi:tRNA adenosine(34) deaminase TadA [Pseudoalteromonas sp. NBT06-2]|nr:tRNA adenosine(34) deaminase TadA [Pseudoalteromonas sp. NBT06-2]